jgi:hypothetical protein
MLSGGMLLGTSTNKVEVDRHILKRAVYILSNDVPNRQKVLQAKKDALTAASGMFKIKDSIAQLSENATGLKNNKDTITQNLSAFDTFKNQFDKSKENEENMLKVIQSESAEYDEFRNKVNFDKIDQYSNSSNKQLKENALQQQQLIKQQQKTSEELTKIKNTIEDSLLSNKTVEKANEVTFKTQSTVVTQTSETKNEPVSDEDATSMIIRYLPKDTDSTSQKQQPSKKQQAKQEEKTTEQSGKTTNDKKQIEEQLLKRQKALQDSLQREQWELYRTQVEAEKIKFNDNVKKIGTSKKINAKQAQVIAPYFTLLGSMRILIIKCILME